MTDWSKLEHAYGKAADVPSLLAELSPDPNAQAWGELWSRICHQGTVYSASFAALPVLADLAQEWKPADRCQILALASSIVASDDVAGPRNELFSHVASVLPRFRELCRESLTVRNLPQLDFIYLLQAARAFNEDQFWGLQLDHLVDGEFLGICPHCVADLYLVIGKYGFFTTAENCVRNPTASRTEIVANDGMMENAGEWLFQQAQTSGQYEVAKWIRYVFGSSKCPSCGEGFRVPDAIRAGRPGHG